MEQRCEMYRKVLKPIWDDFNWKNTPRLQKLARPEFFKRYESDVIVELSQNINHLEKHNLRDSIQLRRSIREYDNSSLSFEEFSYLVSNTCKTIKISDDKALSLGVIPVPGAIKSIETYIYVNDVTNMTSGLYHYDLIDNNLHLVNKEINQEMVKNAIRNQTKGTNVVFFWTTSPGRTEYKYSYLSHKMIAMEAGHTCQNLYLACTCIGLGTVAIGAYSQEQCDAMLGVDGQDEFTIYTAAVGRPLKVEGVDKHAN